MTITLEAVRAAGGIVHSDGNIFFRDISMLQGLAGAAPAAVAGPAPKGWRLVPATPTRDWIAAVADGGYEDCDCASLIADILSRAPAAPAVEAPAVPAGDEEAAFTKWFQGEQGKPYQGMWEFARAAWMARAAAPQAPAAPVLGGAERLAAARQGKSIADYWRNRVAGLAEEFTTAEAARYLADRIVADLYDLAPSGVARPAAPAARALGRSTAQAVQALQEMWDDLHKSGSPRVNVRAMRYYSDALSTVESALLAAPAAPAVDASDTALLDAMERERIALVPEYEGPWDAQMYGEGAWPQHIGSGDTPREALRAAIAAQAKEGGAAA